MGQRGGTLPSCREVRVRVCGSEGVGVRVRILELSSSTRKYDCPIMKSPQR